MLAKYGPIYFGGLMLLFACTMLCEVVLAADTVYLRVCTSQVVEGSCACQNDCAKNSGQSETCAQTGNNSPITGNVTSGCGCDCDKLSW